MLTFQQRRFIRQITSSRLVHLVLCMVLVFSAVSAYGRYAIAVEMAERKMAAERELVELEERRAALSEQVQYITSERGIEAEMRRQFDIAREGEQVVIIIDEQPPVGQ